MPARWSVRGHRQEHVNNLEIGDAWLGVDILLAVIAGWLGFFGLADLAAGIAKGLFLIFLVLLVLSFLVRALRGDSVL